MKGKIFYSFFVFLLIISLASAATGHGKLSVGTGSGGQVIIDSGGCQEDWSGSTGWGNCINNIQTFLCYDRNQCGTFRLRPANCSETRDCPIPKCGDSICNNGETCSTCPEDCGCSSGYTCSSGVCTTTPSSDGNNNNGGNTGGNNNNGGSGPSTTGHPLTPLTQTSTGNTCIEKWECTEWSDSDNQCGTRTCEDVSKCGTTNLKPKIDEKCSSVGLFEITGGVIGGITNFAKSGAGVVTLIILVMGAFVVIILSKKKINKKF